MFITHVLLRRPTASHNVITIVDQSEFEETCSAKPMYCYTGGRTNVVYACEEDLFDPHNGFCVVMESQIIADWPHVKALARISPPLHNDLLCVYLELQPWSYLLTPTSSATPRPTCLAIEVSVQGVIAVEMRNSVPTAPFLKIELVSCGIPCVVSLPLGITAQAEYALVRKAIQFFTPIRSDIFEDVLMGLYRYVVLPRFAEYSKGWAVTQ